MEAVDARRDYPKEFSSWREDPSNFCVNGVYPVRKLWETAREAWNEILLTPVCKTCLSCLSSYLLSSILLLMNQSRERISWWLLTNQF